MSYVGRDSTSHRAVWTTYRNADDYYECLRSMNAAGQGLTVLSTFNLHITQLTAASYRCTVHIALATRYRAACRCPSPSVPANQLIAYNI
eukprot:scaffold420609_cov34-Prasinocladus_malaysianus.AAC.1